VFVSLSPTASDLHGRFAPIAEALAPFRMQDSVEVARYDAVWASNWKLGIEGASESYHHMGLHAQTVEPGLSSRGTYVGESSPWWVEHFTPMTATAESTLPDLTARDLSEAHIITLFPGLVILTNGELVYWQTWTPLTAGKTRVVGAFMFPPSSVPFLSPDVREHLQKLLETVNAEDQLGTEAIQRAAHSRFAEVGYLSHREAALPAFYSFLARALLG
jgi:hypothetical protein